MLRLKLADLYVVTIILVLHVSLLYIIIFFYQPMEYLFQLLKKIYQLNTLRL